MFYTVVSEQQSLLFKRHFVTSTMSTSSYGTCKQAQQRSLVHTESPQHATGAHTCDLSMVAHTKSAHNATGAHTFDQLGYVACQEQSSGKLGVAPCHLWWWWPPSAHCQICAGRSTSPRAPQRVHPAPSPKHAKRDAT